MEVDMEKIDELITLLKEEEYVYIQTHNFPDHDAVASAFALGEFFKNFGISSRLTYEGSIQRDSLRSMIQALRIPIAHAHEYNMTESDKIVIVDGCKGNKNVTDLVGDEIAVIDHHLVNKAEDVAYHDIRSEYGACASIITYYFLEHHLIIPEDVATALLIGINMDTALLTRGVGQHDIDAYSVLYTIADVRMVNSILRNYIQQKDLSFYKEAIERVTIKKRVAFCFFPHGCNQNMLGILGDFFLALKEVDFVVLAAHNGSKINFSLRNENSEWNCSQVIQSVLSGIGFGGGHAEMAGGIINDLSSFDKDEIFSKFLGALYH